MTVVTRAIGERDPVRLCLVSSYLPQRCGIAAYTASLARALAGRAGVAEVSVLAERGALDGRDGKVRSLQVFRRTHDYTTAVSSGAAALGADVVHVQHSSDIFGYDARLPRLLASLRARRVASVVTLHSVHSRFTAALERKKDVVDFHRRIGALADAVVVHADRGMRDELLRQGVPASKVHVVPHGTELAEPLEQGEARRRLGLPEGGPLLVYFGFVHPQKSVHTLLFAMRHVATLVPEARLCVWGAVQNPSRVNRAYAAWLGWLASRPALASRVELRPGFAAVEDVRALLRAADVVLLPYREGYGSASGVAHQAIGAGRLVLCSSSPKFSELADGIGEELIVPSHGARDWAVAIARLLREEPLRRRLLERATAYADATAWPHVGDRHVAVYRSARSAVQRDKGRASAALHRGYVVGFGEPS